MSRSNTPLALVDIKEIMTELADRYEAVIFAGTSGHDQDTDLEYVWYAGSPSTCLGLASRTGHRINVDQSDQMQSLDD